MKKLKEDLEKLDERYVSIEALSETEKKSTYGGAAASISKIGGIAICYGVVAVELEKKPRENTICYGVKVPDKGVLA